MDRKGTASVLIGAAAAVLLIGGAAASLRTIHAARWLGPDVDPVDALGTTRTECLSTPANADQAYLVEIGRAAFRTPMVLGGQAARAGLSCESCHQNGRRNPDFDFPGLSGAPGTADVTSALFSSHRDDGIDNPVPIPDLSGPKSRLKTPQDAASGALEAFIHGLITEEFDGAEPPPVVLKGLAAYVRALSPTACPTAARQPVRLDDFVEEARRAVRVAERALDHHDDDAALVMIGAARWRLGLIYERYDDPTTMRSRALIHTADLDLAAAADAVRAHDRAGRERLAVWLAHSADWASVVQGEAPRSLFNPARLAALAAAAKSGR